MDLPTILDTLNYADRAKQLHHFGAAGGAEALAACDSIGDDTFEALATIAVARGARAADRPARFIGHPSAMVRRYAVSCGLLSADDAKSIFMSPNTSKQMKVIMVRCCLSLPVDETTLAAAQQLEGCQAGWALLQRCTDARLFKESALSAYPGDKVPVRLAKRFPEIFLELQAQNCSFAWDYEWLLPVAQHDVVSVLHLLLINNLKVPCPEGDCRYIVRWAWRHRTQQMLSFLLENKCRFSTVSLLKELLSVKHPKSFNEKLEIVVTVYKKEADPKLAKDFVKLLPPCDAKRTKHCADLIKGFWEIVTLHQGANVWELFRVLAENSILPSSLLVQEFLVSHERARKRPDLTMFKFMHALPGLDDEARFSIFDKLLERDDILRGQNVQIKPALEIFQQLLGAAKVPTVLRQAFDRLVDTFDGRAVRGVLAAVVEKMSALETKLHVCGSEGLPREWVYLCAEEAPQNDACAALLHTTLLNLAEGPLLDSLVVLFGRRLFWDLMGVVLQGSKSSVLVRCKGNLNPQLQALAELECRNPKQAVGKEIYFAAESEVKKQTYGKDFNARQNGYMQLLKLASKDVDNKPRVYQDLVPYLVQRLDKEQENVKFAILSELLSPSLFSAELWAANCDHLRAFWTSCINARSKQDRWKQYFVPLASNIVRQSVKQWETRHQPALEFAVEVLGIGSNYADFFQELHTRAVPLDAAAVEWLFDLTVPANAQTSPLELLNAISTMANCDSFDGSQRKVWEQYSFIQHRWAELLQYNVEPSNMNTALTGLVQHFIMHNRVEAQKCSDIKYEYWWEPVAGDAYQKMVSTVLEKLAAIEVRPALGLSLIRERLQLLASMKKDLNTNALPCDSVQEIKAALRIVENVPAIHLRDALWEAKKIGATSPEADPVVWAALKHLGAHQEGCARLVQSSQKHIREKLSPDGSCLLTLLLNRYLGQCTSTERAARVAEICERPDAAMLLFFGDTFARHLALRCQQMLHSLLEHLQAPCRGRHEWYHYERREHALSRIAQLAPTMLLHRRTQTLLLEMGLQSTNLDVLEVFPQLEYVDTSGRVSELLAAYPRDQSSAPAISRTPSSNWEVLDNSGDIWEEVDRRYKALDPPIVTDAMQSREVDALLLSVGRADHTDRALRALAQYSSKIKMAKNALIRTIPGLSAEHARRVLAEIVSNPATGISTRIAMLRLVIELQVQNPQEIYLAAWQDGQCHRDVAVVVLTKLALSESANINDAVARDMFEAVKQKNEEDQAYICRTVLQDIRSQRWALPFLCETVGSWAYIPGLTQYAFSTLLTSKDVDLTSLARALTKMLIDARLLSNDWLHGDAALSREWASVSGSSVARLFASSVADTVAVGSCDKVALRALVDEVFQSCFKHRDNKKIPEADEVFRLWATLLRSETDTEVVDWAVEQIRNRLFDWALAYSQLAEAAVERAISLHNATEQCSTASCWGPAKRAVDLAVQAVGSSVVPHSAQILQSWAKLVAAGGSEADLQRLLATQDVEKSAVELAKVLFEGSHRWPALQWFSQCKDCSVPPREGLRVLAKLCSTAIHKDEAELENALALFDSHKDSPNCAHLVELLKGCRPEVLRRALSWLAPIFPNDTAHLYPNLLCLDPPTASDVVALLKHCETYGEDIPVIPQAAAATCLPQLRSSSLEGARLQAVRLLREREGFEELREMSQDPSIIVRKVCQAALDAKPQKGKKKA